MHDVKSCAVPSRLSLLLSHLDILIRNISKYESNAIFLDQQGLKDLLTFEDSLFLQFLCGCKIETFWIEYFKFKEVTVSVAHILSICLAKSQYLHAILNIGMLSIMK